MRKTREKNIQNKMEDTIEYPQQESIQGLTKEPPKGDIL
jgi:hypothetical protein